MKDDLKDLCEALYEPVMLLEHIKRIYGLECLNVSIGWGGNIDIDIGDEMRVTRTASKWKLEKPLPFIMGGPK